MNKTMSVVLVFLVLVGALFVCCTQKSNVNISTTPAETPTEAKTPTVCNPSGVEVYFYYSDTCPHCMEVKPYVENLTKEYKGVKFYFCNVRNVSECPKESLRFASIVYGVPTVVIYYNNTTLMLIGSNNVKKLGDVLRCLGCCKG